MAATHNDVFHLTEKDPILSVSFLKDDNTLAMIKRQQAKEGGKGSCLIKLYDKRSNAYVSSMPFPPAML